MTILLIKKKISNLKCTARCEFCEENCALYWKWSSIHCFLVETWLIFFSWLGNCSLLLVIRPAFYGIHIILIMHCWFLKLRRNIFYGYSSNCMDMIVHENKTRLKGSGVVPLSACCHAAVAPLFLPTQPSWVGMYFQIFIKRVSGSKIRNWNTVIKYHIVFQYQCISYPIERSRLHLFSWNEFQVAKEETALLQSHVSDCC